MVVALDFEPGVVEALKDIGLEPVSKQDLKDRVRLWDSLKQRVAVQALLYFVHYKEKNSVLTARVRDFFKKLDESYAAATLGKAPPSESGAETIPTTTAAEAPAPPAKKTGSKRNTR